MDPFFFKLVRDDKKVKACFFPKIVIPKFIISQMQNQPTRWSTEDRFSLVFNFRSTISALNFIYIIFFELAVLRKSPFRAQKLL